MILSPFFGDQFDNARTAKDAGFAEVLLVKKATVEELVSVIHKVFLDARLVLCLRRHFGSIKLSAMSQIKTGAKFVHL